MPKKETASPVPGSSKSITIHLKSPRNPSLLVTLPNAAISTTVEDMKTAVDERIVDSHSGKKRVPMEKIKVLYKKKPVTGNQKTVSEILADDEPDLLSGGKEVEFGVMVLGGASTKEDAAEAEEVRAQVRAEARQEQEEEPPNAYHVLDSETFWDDLEDFLIERTHFETAAKKIRSFFADAWSKR